MIASRLLSTSTAAAAFLMTAQFLTPASAAPIMRQARLEIANERIQQVQWRRHHHGYGYGYRRGPGAGALVGGLAAGALIGGAIAAGQANAAAEQSAAYCSQRYRSYDPASGTYLNNDGNRYPCP